MNPLTAVAICGVAMFVAHILFILLFRTKPEPRPEIVPVESATSDGAGPEAVCLLYTSQSPRH